MKLKNIEVLVYWAFVYTPSVVACAVLSWNHTHLLFNDRPSNTEYSTLEMTSSSSELVKHRFVFFLFFYLWGKTLFDTLRTERCSTEPRSSAEQTWDTHNKKINHLQ